MSNSSKYSGKRNEENLSKEEFKQMLEDWQKKEFEKSYQVGYETAETNIKEGLKVTAEPDIEYDTAGYQFGHNQAIKDNLSKWKSGELPEVEPRAEETKMKGKDKIFEVVDDREAYEKRAEEKREWMRKQNQKFLEQRGL